MLIYLPATTNGTANLASSVATNTYGCCHIIKSFITPPYIYTET